MKKHHIIFYYFSFFLLSILMNQNVEAQFQGNVYVESQNGTVKQFGNSILTPWVGGINSVQINHSDLNNDGKKDLVLYDKYNYIFRTFLNIGNSGEIKYAYAPQYEKNFPNVLDYVILKDYNCDGVDDLFERGYAGVSVHRGYYDNNELKFSFFKELYYPGQNGPVNVYVQPSDIPSIFDIDKDGDLDVLAYDVFGAYIIYYKNMQVELGLPCDSIRMELADNCWGQIYQGISRAVNLNVNCKGVAGQNKKTRHAGNTIIHLDIDGDGDFDILGGNLVYNDAQLLYNNGSNIINAQDTNYNKNGHKLNMPYWPTPHHIDIDNNGSHDILFTTHSDYLENANYNTVAWYKNIGSDASPNFVYQHDSLLVSDMIDLGAYSYPTFFDYDKDGRPDLFVGCEGVFNNNTFSLSSKIAYYRNTSTPGNISFELITKNFLNLSSKNYKGIFPTFGDLTGDGVDDLVLGNANGSISIYKNFAISNNAQPDFQFFTDSLNNVFVEDYSFPVVYDFNKDGKTDLIIGDQMGILKYYEDTSTAVNLKKLAVKKDTLGNIKIGSVYTNFGYGAPFIGRTDNSSNVYLVVGNGDGNIERYREDFINNLGTFTRIDSTYSNINLISRTVPAICDIDGDGMFEMLVGNKLGGLKLYKQVLTVGTADVSKQKNNFILYPNPTQATIHILFQTPLSNEPAQLSIFDITGKLVLGQQFIADQHKPIDVGFLQPGIYYVSIETKNQTMRNKFIKMGAQ